ncbi:MAG: hypothetical protein JKY54_02035 [Flavobacteriales bacterium]|nr:hypothetical protein [Flavobacteriales bacterium]
MKKGILTLLVVGALLTSCSEDPNVVAANALCGCLQDDDATKKAQGIAIDEDDKNGNTEATNKFYAEQDEQQANCIQNWKSKYKIAKDDIDFRLTLQEISKSVYKKASKIEIID